jgi:hypothetical protein
VSFTHLSDQLVTEDYVGNSSAPIFSTSADVSNCEIVPLKQFARAGKRGHYLSYGVCVIDSESAMPSLDVSKMTNALTKD